MKKRRRSMIFALISNLIFLLAIIQNAYAYIDPGTANIIVQVIIGSIVSFLFMIKLYWNKVSDHRQSRWLGFVNRSKRYS